MRRLPTAPNYRRMLREASRNPAPATPPPAPAPSEQERRRFWTAGRITALPAHGVRIPALPTGTQKRSVSLFTARRAGLGTRHPGAPGTQKWSVSLFTARRAGLTGRRLPFAPHEPRPLIPRNRLHHRPNTCSEGTPHTHQSRTPRAPTSNPQSPFQPPPASTSACELAGSLAASVGQKPPLPTRRTLRTRPPPNKQPKALDCCQHYSSPCARSAHTRPPLKNPLLKTRCRSSRRCTPTR